ncbi:MAG: hypothetical protein EXS05_11475 [Planctomycetaceae bacterium]|nr:hypothetical protein [Planctomycetaceae bacterium]
MAKMTKAAAITDMLIRHPAKGPKEISELFKAEGWDIAPNHISVVKSSMVAKTRPTGPVNKSAAIRDALKAHRDKTPLELSELLKADGLKVSTTYISTIKSKMKMKRKARKASRKAAISVPSPGNRHTPLDAAVEFIKSAGGLEAAKAALGTVEEIGKAL